MARQTDPEAPITEILADVKQAERLLNERIYDLATRHKHKVEIDLLPVQAIGAPDSFRVSVKVFKEIL
jgi:hypothetical protein